MGGWFRGGRAMIEMPL